MRTTATQVPAKSVVPSGRPLPRYVVRGALTATAIGIWFWTQSLISQRPVPTSGIGDVLFHWTGSANLFFHLHPAAANGLLIASSAIIDALSIFLLASWIFGRSVRPFLGLVLVLGLRQLMQALVALPAPAGVIWHYPGFPSLLVTYSVSNDYFFSAHTSIAVLGAAELIRTQRRWLRVPAALFVIFEMGTLIVLRAHYTMDIFTGFIAALLSAYCAARFAPFLDERLHKLAT